jgi:site-specific DNA-adenine methylase
MKKLEIPCSYQGGKQRLAKEIVDIIFNQNEINQYTKFYDLCCGSGAISVEIINRGIKPSNITMLDASPWGLFWKMIGNQEFKIDKFIEYIENIPNDVSLIQSHIKELYKQPANIDTVYKFLLLQASSFGSKAIWLKNDAEWATSSFRNYWLPTETSSRRSPVNPMMPMPNTLLERVKNIANRMAEVNGLNTDITELKQFEESSIIYIDPPYLNTSGYGYTFDLHNYIEEIEGKAYISEGYKFTDNAILMSGKRDKGGISGDRKVRNEEWLNVYM